MLYVVNSELVVPDGWLEAGSVIAAVVFLGLPIFGIYFGSKLNWTPSKAAALFIGCLGFLALPFLVANFTYPTTILYGLIQIARLGWPFALGLLITGLIKDKNLLLPIAVVLATVDILAVFAPVGTVKQGLQSETIRPVFDALAIQVPDAGSSLPQAQLGPADPLFLGMFFYATHKFKMRERATFLLVLPALILYLVVVLALGHRSLFGISLGALPALVPMGIAVIVANFREFDPSKDEKLMIAVVSALCAAVLVYAAIIW
ncbi:MAG: hypothetical protein H0W86_03230 [Armatimonadetes bacterium]|nr:hypothetical protein [Armatimonadota bacterium]